jgi:hypothetical protein
MAFLIDGYNISACKSRASVRWMIGIGFAPLSHKKP